MSTLEMPACLALLIVMANLALCLSTDNRRPAQVMNLPGIETLGGCSDATRLTRPC